MVMRIITNIKNKNNNYKEFHIEKNKYRFYKIYFNVFASFADICKKYLIIILKDENLLLIKLMNEYMCLRINESIVYRKTGRCMIDGSDIKTILKNHKIVVKADIIYRDIHSHR